MDFSNVKLFGKKNFADLLKEIHTNQKDKEVQLRSLIEGLKPLITSPGEATMIVPLIKEYMELGLKNDEALIKVATIFQRIFDNEGNEDSGFSISEEEREQLLNDIKKLTPPPKKED